MLGCSPAMPPDEGDWEADQVGPEDAPLLGDLTLSSGAGIAGSYVA